MRGTIGERGESLTTTEQLSNSMYFPGKHPSFNVGFNEPTGLSCQDNASDPQLHHQGMSVQTLNSSCPPYFSQLAADQNSADSIHPLLSSSSFLYGAHIKGTSFSSNTSIDMICTGLSASASLYSRSNSLIASSGLAAKYLRICVSSAVV